MSKSKPGRHVAVKGKKTLWRKNKTGGKWVSFLQPAKQEAQGGDMVVKGISKRVIVVKGPDERIFEQAIFIIREDFAGQRGVSEKDVLMQARQAADDYLHLGRGVGEKLRVRLRAPLYAAAGAVATALAWLAMHLVRL